MYRGGCNTPYYPYCGADVLPTTTVLTMHLSDQDFIALGEVICKKKEMGSRHLYLCMAFIQLIYCH